eukprot:TRINITY_DN128_c0_g1_i2.p1 TRINITY_DN128_c0_g1~~TRINITY_DN128_c0_g1_i2.p1  ORF type:complete len:202 (-),score=72.21 TRINITY_DN128_c0_g1_i2:47-652(-)
MQQQSSNWRTWTMVASVCSTAVALYLAGSMIFSESSRPGSLGGIGGILFAIVQVLWLLALGVVGFVGAWKRQRKAVLVYVAMIGITMVGIVIMLIVQLAQHVDITGPVRKQCEYQAYDENQCAVMIKIAKFSMIGVPLCALCYCACYGAMAVALARNLRTDNYYTLDAELERTAHFDEFGDSDPEDQADAVPQVHVDASVI